MNEWWVESPNYNNYGTAFGAQRVDSELKQ